MVRHERSLDDFINERLSEHKEPTRKGVPKGEPIGPPRHKVHASLLCALTAMTLKEISGDLGISYDLLMKWNSQKDFLDLTESHLDDFTTYFLRRIADHAEALRNGRREFPKGQVGEGRYGFGLLLNICQEMKDSEKRKDPFFALAAYLALKQLKRDSERKSWPHKRELDKRFQILKDLSGVEERENPMMALERVANQMGETVLGFVHKALRGKNKKEWDSATLLVSLLRRTL